MLSVVVAAALAPNTGVVQAQTSSPYGQPSSSGLSPYVYLGIAAVVIVAALLLALLMLSRRRRRPPAAVPPTIQAWQEGPTPPPGSAPPPPAAPPAAAPAYLETPEDVGHAPPAVPVTKAEAAAAVAAPVAPAAAEGEPDIDSLMAELDKISSEILKRAPKKGAQKPPETPEEELGR
jgi:hypothetical protein